MAWSIGDTGPAGGKIFYVFPDGRALEAQTGELTDSEWGGHGTQTNVISTVIGDGQTNTSDINTLLAEADIAADRAADYSQGGYADWYLPSLGELYQMYIRRAIIGGFDLTPTGVYWSSSEDTVDGTNQAMVVIFSFGGVSADLKNSTAHVKAIRTVAASMEASSVIVMSSSATLTGTKQISGSAVIVLSATAIAANEPEAEIEKNFIYRVYDSEDNYLGIWKDVISELRIKEEINSAGSAVEVILGRAPTYVRQVVEDIHTETAETVMTEDSITLGAFFETPNVVGEDTDVDLNYRVDIYVSYGSLETLLTESGQEILTEAGDFILASLGAPEGVRIFSGYISRYKVQYANNDAQVIVTVMGHGAELDNRLVHSGATTTVTKNSYDPSDMLTDILDTFSADGGLLTYNLNSIDDTGTTVSYTFRLNTVLEAIKKIVELAPSDWYWRVDQGENLVHFHARPSTPDHTFVLGLHISNAVVERTLENIINDVPFVGGGEPPLYKRYQDATSQSDWRVGLLRMTDQRVTSADTAQILAESEMERNAEPVFNSLLEILDSNYEIETIHVGHLIGFANFNNFVDDLELQIVGLTYTPHSVILELDALLPEVNKRVQDIKRNLLQKELEEVGSAPS